MACGGHVASFPEPTIIQTSSGFDRVRVAVNPIRLA
jgi:hypothetical protein